MRKKLALVATFGLAACVEKTLAIRSESPRMDAGQADMSLVDEPRSALDASIDLENRNTVPLEEISPGKLIDSSAGKDWRRVRQMGWEIDIPPGWLVQNNAFRVGMRSVSPATGATLEIGPLEPKASGEYSDFRKMLKAEQHHAAGFLKKLRVVATRVDGFRAVRIDGIDESSFKKKTKWRSIVTVGVPNDRAGDVDGPGRAFSIWLDYDLQSPDHDLLQKQFQTILDGLSLQRF